MSPWAKPGFEMDFYWKKCKFDWMEWWTHDKYKEISELEIIIKKKTSPEDIKEALCPCAEFPLQPQMLYTWSLFMWKCPRPRPNHKGPPQLGVCAEVTQSILSPPIFSLLAVWLRRAAFNAGTESYCCDPKHHYRSDETLRTVGSRWCRVLWAILKNLLLFQSVLMTQTSSALS